MAQERDSIVARTAPGELTKEELQRRMEETRESIAHTVEEIKDNVATQYQQVKEALDWREQFRRRPLAFTAGAFGVGFLLGYSIGGSLTSGEEESWDTRGVATPYEKAYMAPAAESEKPSVVERLKESRAYARLQEEISNIGERAVEQLATTAQTVVLPLLFAKVGEIIGLDLSGRKKEPEKQPEPSARAASAAASTEAATSAQSTRSGGYGSA
ncbi:MAG: hypothetical protein C4334_11830 [Pyrinomonas sp.]|uniref:hypothetical protein n=1 Tax=Pyrinomonas sp. TaxID=2080306 RepID=UPI00332EB924